MEASSLRVESRVFFMRSSVSWSRTSLAMCALPYQRSDGLARDHARQVSARADVEHDDGQFVLHAQRDGRRIHDLEALVQNVEIRDRLVTRRVAVALRVLVVHAVDARALEDDLRADLDRAQRGRGIGGEVRIARPRAED